MEPEIGSPPGYLPTNVSSATNGSDEVAANGSCDRAPPGGEGVIELDGVRFVAPIAVLIVFDLAVIFGNTLVVLAVTTHVKLRTATNTFVISLAVADLMVGVSVLPFSIANEVLRYWPFGVAWCRVWLAVDVWMCTASILSLCAISLDRYLAISRPFRYPRLMSQSRARVLVTLVWIASFLICFPPLIDWKDGGAGGGGDDDDPSGSVGDVTDPSGAYGLGSGSVETTQPGPLPPDVAQSGSAAALLSCPGSEALVCELTSEPGYIVYSALGSFWIPVWIMGFFYWKIYRTAAKTTGAIRRGVLTTKSTCAHNSPEAEVTLRVHRGGGGVTSAERAKFRYRADERSGRHLEGTAAPPGSVRRASKTPSLPGDAYEKNGYFHGRKQPKIRVKFAKTIRNGIQTKRGERQPLNRAGSRDINDHNHHHPPEPSGKGKQDMTSATTPTEESAGDVRPGIGFLNKVSRIQLRSHMKRMNREKKAAKTVGIIVGCFIVCWAPFFTVYLLGAFCPGCTPNTLFTIFFWLGYCNSAVNPCLYAMCSKDFRYAFKKLLRCRLERRRENERRGTRFIHFLNSIRIQISTRGSDSISD